MCTKSSRIAGRLVATPLLAFGLAAASGCGGQNETGDDSGGADLLARRSRQVAAAWNGSTAAAAWRAGYHPMGEVVQLPRGGLHSKADEQAYQERNFVLRSKLPDAAPKAERVTWPGKGNESLTRPLMEVRESYESLAGGRADRKPHLTVTRAKLGEMSLATSRGTATVPAWLFTLDGYASPLKLAAATPSKDPHPPIERTSEIPGYPIDQLVRVAADGRSVTVVALHCVCEGEPAVSVLETRGSAVLSASVVSRKNTGNCTAQAKMQQVTVALEHPLGDRVLLDAHTGRPVTYKGVVSEGR
ncbi:hypothetical protein ACFYO9_12110 [Streptomyces sp. NPDC005863]|uniref:hypothetical protein n=1 Tax=unclassified Streptomyces TaxID=2593676 RepID=UPI0033E1E962